MSTRTGAYHCLCVPSELVPKTLALIHPAFRSFILSILHSIHCICISIALSSHDSSFCSSCHHLYMHRHMHTHTQKNLNLYIYPPISSHLIPTLIFYSSMLSLSPQFALSPALYPSSSLSLLPTSSHIFIFK